MGQGFPLLRDLIKQMSNKCSDSLNNHNSSTHSHASEEENPAKITSVNECIGQ